MPELMKKMDMVDPGTRIGERIIKYTGERATDKQARRERGYRQTFKMGVGVQRETV